MKQRVRHGRGHVRGGAGALLALAAVVAPVTVAALAAGSPQFYVPTNLNPADVGFGDFVLKFWLPLVDLEQRDRYAAANAALVPADPARPRVVFLGDSITDGWTDLESAPLGTLRIEALNRGISGQVSTQMLLRLQSDVLALAPSVLVLLAGTNDIRVGSDWTAGATPRQITRLLDNLASIVDAARGRGVRVVLATLPPVHDATFNPAEFPVPSTTLRSPAVIERVNMAIRELAAARNLRIVDYHSALRDAEGRMRREASDDGLHPNAEGYRRMRAALVPVLAQTLADPAPR